MGGVTTHDALTYSTKAATHKHVHPYLRYGFLAGGIQTIPGRLIKHGASSTLWFHGALWSRRPKNYVTSLEF